MKHATDASLCWPISRYLISRFQYQCNLTGSLASQTFCCTVPIAFCIGTQTAYWKWSALRNGKGLACETTLWVGDLNEQFEVGLTTLLAQVTFIMWKWGSPKMGTPFSWENGVPGPYIFLGKRGPVSPYYQENGNPGSLFSREYGDPLYGWLYSQEHGDHLYGRPLSEKNGDPLYCWHFSKPTWLTQASLSVVWWKSLSERDEPMSDHNLLHKNILLPTYLLQFAIAMYEPMQR